MMASRGWSAGSMKKIRFRYAGLALFVLSLVGLTGCGGSSNGPIIIITATPTATSTAVPTKTPVATPTVTPAPVAAAPYTLAPLTKLVPPGGATQPDDLAVSADGTDLWIGYGNGVDTTGKGGPSNVVEYDLGTGAVLQNLSIPGHVDGLKINPTTNDVWATENEDGNPTLAEINHRTGASTIYKFSPTLITGGFDDLVFAGSGSADVFIVT